MKPTEVSPRQADELQEFPGSTEELDRRQKEPASALPLPSAESLDYYKVLYEDTPSMSFALVPDGTILSVNRFGAEQLGYSPENLVGQSVLRIFDPTDHQTVREQLILCSNNPYKIFQWEIQKVHYSGRRLWVKETARAVRDSGGALMVLVMCEDITAKKAAEDQAHDLTTKLEALILTSPLAIMALDPTGECVTLWNHAAEEMFGWSEQEVIGRPTPFYTPDCQEESDRLWNELIERGQLQGAELRRKRRDGTPIDLLLWATVLRDQRGNIVSTFGILTDITERKRMESTLRLNEQSVRALCEITSDVTTEFDQQIRAVLDLGRRRFQLPIAAFTTLKDRQLKPMIIRSDNRIIQEEVILPLCETFCSQTLAVDHPLTFQRLGTSRIEEHASLPVRQFETYLGSRITVHGKPVGTICFLSDESVPVRFSETDLDFLHLMARWVGGELERQQAEARLRDSEERFRLMFEKAPVGMCIVNPDRSLRKVNPAFQRLVGYSEEEIVGNTDALYTHPDDLSVNLLITDQCFRGEIPGYHLEKRYVRKDGRLIWVGVTASSLQLPGESDRLLLAIIEDITARKQAIEALRGSENRLRALYDQAPLGIAVIDSLKGQFEQVNQKYCEITGYSKEDMLARTFQDITYPDDLQEDLHNMAKLLSGRIDSFRMEKRYIRKDGSIVWVNLTCVPLWLDASDRRLHIAMVEDITDRKQTEEALQESEIRFRQITETIEEVFWSADPAIGKTLYISPAYERVWGRTSASLYEDPKSFLDAIHAEDRARVLATLSVQRNGLPFSHEYRVVRPDGVTRWVWDRGFPVRDPETGVLTHYVGVAADITERKQAEEALRASEERFSKAFLSSPHPIVVTELDTGRCLEVNDASLQLFGFRRDEVIGHTTFSLGLWPTPLDRARFIDRLNAEGSLRNLDLTFFTKDRIARRFLVSCELIELNGTTCVVTVGSDITDQKRAEEALRRSEMEVRQAFEERERLSQDLHDNLLQSLYAVGMGLERTQQRIRWISRANAEQLEHAVGQLNRIIREVRDFIPRMQPPVAREERLDEALRSLVRSYSSTGTGEVASTIDEATAMELPQDMTAHLLAIAKEALSNSVRHTKATKRSLSLRRDNGRIRLEISDNGRGFSVARRRTHGMGLKNMRARARSLGGHFTIKSVPGKGTLIRLEIPRSAQSRDVAGFLVPENQPART